MTANPVVVDGAAIDALRGLDTATVYNILKGTGRATLGAFTGPELRCLVAAPVAGSFVGLAVTSAWTSGEPDAPNGDYLAFLEGIERSPGPAIAVLADVGSRPGRSGVAGDGMMGELRAIGATAAIVGGSVMDVAGMERLGLPVWATGVVPAYDDLRMASWGEPIEVAGLTIRTGELLVVDRAGVVPIPLDAVPALVAGIPGFRRLEESMQAMIGQPGMSVARLREWYAANEPEFLGGGTGGSGETLRRAVEGEN